MWEIPDYNSFSLEQWSIYILFGVIGYLIRLSVTQTEIIFPRLNGSGLKLNAFGELITSVTVGCLIDNNILFVTVGAISAPIVITWILENTQKYLNRLKG